MKIYFIFFLIITITITVFSQQQVLMSDVQFDGLKSKVKTVLSERTAYNQNGEVTVKRGEYSSLTSYDQDGNKIESANYSGKTTTSKINYWRKNGELFYKQEVLSVPKQSSEMSPPPPPKEIGDKKTTPRDISFDTRIQLNYDQKGNLIEKLVYGNNGVFNNRRVYEYDANRNKLKEAVFVGDGKLFNDSTKYIYDSKGSVIQEASFVTSASREESTALPERKLDYEYVKFDEKGNWLERKVFESMRRGVENEPKLIAVEYQIITYH